MVDLSQDQDQSAGASNAAAEPCPPLGNGSRQSDSVGHGAEAKLKSALEEAQPHGRLTGNKRSGRLQEASQDAGAVDNVVGGQKLTRKIQQHSKSGVEVEMEEI